MLSKHKKEYDLWIESFRVYFLENCYKLERSFNQDFFINCIESVTADLQEILLDTNTQHNFFLHYDSQEKELLIFRFYKLIAIHSTVCISAKQPEYIEWSDVKHQLFFIFQCSKEEIKIAEYLYHAITHNSYEFQISLIKITVFYLFELKILTDFYFAFLGNFWYNSYNNFIISFTQYVPFSVRIDKYA